MAATRGTTPAPDRRLPLTRRAQLGVEVVVTYLRTKRAARHADVRQAVEAVRAGRSSRRQGEPLSPAAAARLGHAVTRTLTALPLDDRCLAQSLVLTSMLARRGTPSTLVIGARPGAEFGAHAWVEVEGRPVLPADDAEYPRLVEL